ncbi:MAG: hypothetical protein AAB875_07165, partial [Patescibacteria group bacterium]
MEGDEYLFSEEAEAAKKAEEALAVKKKQEDEAAALKAQEDKEKADKEAAAKAQTLGGMSEEQMITLEKQTGMKREQLIVTGIMVNAAVASNAGMSKVIETSAID